MWPLVTHQAEMRLKENTDGKVCMGVGSSWQAGRPEAPNMCRLLPIRSHLDTDRDEDYIKVSKL